MAGRFLANEEYLEPSRPVAIARILVGAAALLQLPRLRSQMAILLPQGTFRVPYPLSPHLGPAAASVLAGVMAVLAISAIVGWHSRISLAVLAAAVALVLSLDQQLYRNDLYLLALECGLLAWAESGAALSLDAWRRGGKDFVDGWPVLLLKVQLTVVYASTALSKLNPSFLSGEVLQISIRHIELSDRAAASLSVAAIVIEAFLALALWLGATRKAGLVLGFLFHTSFLFLLSWGPYLVAFELQMAALYVLFIRNPQTSGTAKTRAKLVA